MNKTELINAIAENAGLAKTDAKKALEATLGAIAEAVKKGDKVALIGFGNSNVFSIIFAHALTAVPEKKNEVSGLMIMGLFGGTIFPLFMGLASDAIGQRGAVAVMAVGVLYLIFYTLKLRR